MTLYLLEEDFSSESKTRGGGTCPLCYYLELPLSTVLPNSTGCRDYNIVTIEFRVSSLFSVSNSGCYTDPEYPNFIGWPDCSADVNTYG